MEGSVAGVRILPAVVQFHDADPGVLHQMTLKVQNLSKISKSVRFHAPESKYFSIKVQNPDGPIAPGLDVTALVEYYTEGDDDQQDCAILVVDDDIVEIPLIAFKPCPQMEICGPVDFGSTIADGRVLIGYFSIDNYGSKSGDFKIKYNGQLPITIIPTNGTIEAETSHKIKVEFISKDVGKFKETINIKLEGQEDGSLDIFGNVVEQHLELYNMSDDQLIHCITFGPTYYGTDQLQSYILHNNGPDAIDYIVVLDEDVDGQEVGSDLTKNAMAIISEQTDQIFDTNELDHGQKLTSLITVLPNQGKLGAGEKTGLNFIFSPRFQKSTYGWKNNEEKIPRKDYALFMYIEAVGSLKKQQQQSCEKGCRLEIGLRATAIPVNITIKPTTLYVFEQCFVGEQLEALCRINNNSKHLPISFSIDPVAHFHAKPLRSVVKKCESCDVMISFKPNQMGKFSSKLQVKILGRILQSKTQDSFSFTQHVILTLLLHVQGACVPRPGIIDSTIPSVEIAEPNDRATSIRPANRSNTKIKTKFTGVERYSYIDPDFTFTKEERMLKNEHKRLYLDYIRDSRVCREQKIRKRESAKWEDDKNLGIQPAYGLKPSKLSTKQAEVVSEKIEQTSCSVGSRLLSTKSITTATQVVEGLNAIPLTDIEKLDCGKSLTPQELKKIEIESTSIDFGQVCQRSVKTQYLTVSNNLDQHLHIVVKIDCRELRQSSPLSQVIPPHSIARVSLVFESNTKGVFERSIDYTINDHHRYHVIITAQVVSVALQLSSNEITLKPTSCKASESGFRSFVSVKNERNLAADFSWKVIDCKEATSFSIRPAKGTVDAFSSLDCEVVFYPSYFCPKTTEFALHVEGGNETRLLCQAEFGASQCSFVERRFMFGCVPLHLTTTRTCHLKNNSQNHAYFQIMNTEPLPGMILTPKQGVVPLGGTTEITVTFTPSFVHKFDTEIEVNVLGWKTISIRVAGTVEEPCVDLNIRSFQFHGVYCGAIAKLPFQLTNKTRSKAKVVFDLSCYLDFSLEFSENIQNIDLSPTATDDGLFVVYLRGLQVLDCILFFKPTEVASYNFMLPVSINDTCAPCPAPSTIPPSPAPSRTNWTIPELDTPAPPVANVATPSRRIQATALRPPLQLSHHQLHFTLPPGYFDLGIVSGAGRVQTCILVNNSNKDCKWLMNTSSSSLFQNGVFSFLRRSGSPFPSINESGIPAGTTHSPCGILQSGETIQLGIMFSPDKPGVYNASIPLILNDDSDQEYRVLEIQGELQSPEIIFKPNTINFKVVPLAIQTTLEFEIIAKGFRKSHEITHELPEVELSDGSRCCLLQCCFPKGCLLSPCYDGQQQQTSRIPCKISFKSHKPVSFSSHVIFIVDGVRYFLEVVATADNCLLTNYPFLAIHQNDFHIVCEPKTQDKSSNGDDNTSISTEAFLLPCITPTRSLTVGSTSATSTAFGISTSSYEDSTNMTSSLNESTCSSAAEAAATVLYDGISRFDELQFNENLDSNNIFLETTPQEAIFFKEVLKTVQRWISMQAWSSGPFPVKLPQYFQNSFRERGDENNVGRSGDVKGEHRTIFQLVAHLCGRFIPGIPVNVTLPCERGDRARKLHWMYSALLVFLKAQGALLAHVKPEYLLSFNDFHEWKKLGREEEEEEKKQYSNEDRSDYERNSCFAWNHLLLQLLKVFILGRITPQQFKKISLPSGDVGLPYINTDPLSSNIYSVGERIILAWLNHHYKSQKQKTWATNVKGTLPSARWIVNFDLDFMDGLVLAALLAAHCPFLIATHLHKMFLHPTTAEQCLHNAIQIVEAFKLINIDYDVVPTDITEANPVSMLLLCIHLYHHLPHYIPRATVDFIGGLHMTITKHVQLQNTSSKPLLYTAILCGNDAEDFLLPIQGINTIQVSPRSHVQLPVEFKSRFLRPCIATLVLIGKRSGSVSGTTLVFTLRTCINNITPRATIKCESPLYEVNKIEVDITNPFPVAGDFRIVLVEARGNATGNTGIKEKKTKTKAKKQIESKTDHGQLKKQKSVKKDVIVPVTPEKKQDHSSGVTDHAITRGFWCLKESIHLDCHGSNKITINFVPFQLGARQCSILLVNEDLGEFLYLIETLTILPLPSRVSYTPACKHSVRVSSSCAALHGRGLFGGDDRVIYWKCDHNETITETILIPPINLAKENALALVGQQNMCRKELRRRELTNTLDVSSITTAMSLLGLIPNYHADMNENKRQSNICGYITFKVKSSSEYYHVPSSIKVPFQLSGNDIGTSLPVRFTPKGSGHYPTTITLKSSNDVRVYQIECTVSPDGGLNTALEFRTPLHGSVTQEIPLANHTKQDWQMIAVIEGEGFYGPPVLVAKADMTSYYPLMFKPTCEETVTGKLVLTNVVDGSEHQYCLKGFGDTPASLEHLKIDCEAGKKTVYKIRLPKLKKKRTFNIITDLDMVTGPTQTTILAQKESDYELVVSPWKRGVSHGIISFVATLPSRSPSSSQTTKFERDDSSSSSCSEDDYKNEKCTSRSCNTPNNTPSQSSTSNESTVSPSFRFWYSVEINAMPAAPVKTLHVSCVALSAVAVDITVCNPAKEEVMMNVLLQGVGIHGSPILLLDAGQQSIYHVKYSPTKVGKQQASIIFQHENIGEFWYHLDLVAKEPEAKHLPVIQSELGRHTHQIIHLQNPTNETLMITPYSSNQRNFILELDNAKQLTLAPNSLIEVSLRFTPSQIGIGNHTGKIIFRSQQLGDWTFLARGTGLTPNPSKVLVVHSEMYENSSLIVPFRNPTEHTVITQVTLKENVLNSLLGNENVEAPVFCLLLKHNDGILLQPQEILDIPMSFTPVQMKSYEATVCVTIKPQDTTASEDFSPSDMFNQLSWLFPIKGVPVSNVLPDARALLIECQARDRTEQILELTLSGILLSNDSSLLYTNKDIRTSANLVQEITTREAELEIDNVPFSENFNYEFSYGDLECEHALERCLGVQLHKRYRNKTTGVITLIFRLIFSPYKPFSHLVHFILTAGYGGVWRFPIRFQATEAEVDDTIIVEAIGLNKEAIVGFRLTSQCRQAIPFEATLTSDSDKEFAMKCSCDVLMPQDSQGTLIKVIYKPTLYGKIHKGKIIVQTADMQWMYGIKGVTPEYTPPSGQSLINARQTMVVKQRQKNYVRDNLKLETTAVSSPIKGAPIISRQRR